MPKSKRKLFLVVLLLLLVAFISLEFFLRKVWGLGDMTILFQEDPAFEYIAKPNQQKFRFGNKIIYNEHSMRSLPLREEDECVILGFGDSVLNGGTLTDQDSLATTIVENQLQQNINKGSRFLNVSAGSWGPDNCAAYLNKNGSFNAKMIVLFVSSHDAHDNMTFEKTVGVHESYPERPYPLAFFELMSRYIKPRVMHIIGMDEKKDDLMINKNGVEFNPGFEFFKNFAQKNGIPLVVCLHAEQAEVEQAKFNEQGDEILQYCASNNIKVISGLQIGEALNDFRDGIHINEKGQKRWAKALFNEIQGMVKSCR